MRLTPRPLAVMVPATRSPGRPAVHYDVTGYDRGPALPDDYEPFVGQDGKGVLQRRDPDVL